MFNILDVSITEIGISETIVRTLKDEGFYTVRDIVNNIINEDALKIKLDNNERDVEEVRTRLEDLGVDLFLSRSIDENEYLSKTQRKIDSFGFSDSLISKLQEAGITTVFDLLLELEEDVDVIRLNLTNFELEEITDLLKQHGLSLGIFKEPIEVLGIQDELFGKMKNEYTYIQDILTDGLHTFTQKFSPKDTIRVCQKLRKLGYAIDGYPWDSDPMLFKRIRMPYLRKDISILMLSNTIMERLTMAFGDKPRFASIAFTPLGKLYGILQNYEDCVYIVKQMKVKGLLVFCRYDLGELLNISKQEFLDKYTLLTTPIEKLNIALVIIQTLKKRGIKSIEELVEWTADDLYKKGIAKDSALSSIRGALNEGNLLLKNDSVIMCSHCGERYIGNNINERLCTTCQSRVKRINNSGKIAVTLHGPDYGTYNNMGEGFTLFANFKNISSKVRTVKLLDFYIVEADKQISPKYYLNGYAFDREKIIPDSVKTAGKIWDTKMFEYPHSLSYNVYVMLTIKLDDEESNRVYKFVKDDNSNWIIFDFYKV